MCIPRHGCGRMGDGNACCRWCEDDGMGQWLRGQGLNQGGADLMRWKTHLVSLSFRFLFCEMDPLSTSLDTSDVQSVQSTNLTQWWAHHESSVKAR